MLPNPRHLNGDFVTVAALSGGSVSERDVLHEVLRTPHKPPKLPSGTQAVYVCSTSAPSSVVLKVGKVGPKSNARFRSQHYSPKRSRSNLAKFLLERRDLWKRLGMSGLDKKGVGEWTATHTDRDHFFLAASQDTPLLSLLEVFLQRRLRPVFQG